MKGNNCEWRTYPEANKKRMSNVTPTAREKYFAFIK
jgi:hypothetical protein